MARGRVDLYRRSLDILMSGLLAVLALPIILVAATGSAMALRAWPFFTQDRVGRDGTLFRFVKVRTLPTDMPSYVDKHQLEQHRIPPFCKFLRTFHLDELPQLFLVLRGRMGLVGPRPEMAHLHDRMPASFAALRTAVRPGCTGLWQISESRTGLIGDAPEYDHFYLAHRTLRFDLWVLWCTLAQMVGLNVSVALDTVPAWALSGGTSARVTTLADAAKADSVGSMSVVPGR